MKNVKNKNISNLGKVDNVIIKIIKSNKDKICKCKCIKAVCKNYKQDKFIRKQQAHEEQIDELIVEPSPKRFASDHVVGERKFSDPFS